MPKQFIFFFFIVFIVGCNQSKKPAAEESSTGTDTGFVNKEPHWRDSLVAEYVKKTDNELVRQSRQDTVSVEWLDGGTRVTDSVTYFTFQVGHSFEHNFTTDVWLYIDSASRKVYEYDIPEDKLVEWKK